MGYRDRRCGYFFEDDLFDDVEFVFADDFEEAGLACVDVLFEADFSAADRISDNFFRWVAVSTFSIEAISASLNSASCFSKASTFSR